MSENETKKPWIPPWSIPVAALVLVVVVSAGMHLYRMHLESQVAELETARESLEEEMEQTWFMQSDVEYRCPPILELDPAWAEKMPWGPGDGEDLASLDGGEREVRILDADGTPGPTVSWNSELRVYDLSAAEGAERESFYIGVLREDGTWALTVPSNWPLPLCEPWIDCTAATCDGPCLTAPWDSAVAPPPAKLPEPCRRSI